MAEDDVRQVIDEIEDDGRRRDAESLLEIIERVTGDEPFLEGNFIGFGKYHYRYETGQEGDFPRIAFSPTKQGLTLYVMSGLRGFEDILGRLGPHRVSKSTVKIRRLGDVDQTALADLIAECKRHLVEVEETMGAIPRMSEIPPRRATA